MPFAHSPRATSPPSPHHRFLSRLFSSTYKSLFPQLLSFLIYTKPPGCGGLPFQFFLRDLQDLPTFKTFQTISCVFMHFQTLWRKQKTQVVCNQQNPNSFCKTPGVGVPRNAQTWQGRRSDEGNRSQSAIRAGARCQ